MAIPLSTLVASLCLCAGARAQGFQIWNEADITAAFGNASATVPLVDRIVPRLANPQVLAGGLMTDVRLPAHAVLSVGYLVVDLPQRHPSVVRVPLVALTGAVRIRRFTVADRNRVERLVRLGSSPMRYRNRLSLDWSPRVPNRPHVFVDEEVFYDASAAAEPVPHRGGLGRATRPHTRRVLPATECASQGAGSRPRDDPHGCSRGAPP